jgi:hypothetical protein
MKALSPKKAATRQPGSLGRQGRQLDGAAGATSPEWDVSHGGKTCFKNRLLRLFD